MLEPSVHLYIVYIYTLLHILTPVCVFMHIVIMINKYDDCLLSFPS